MSTRGNFRLREMICFDLEFAVWSLLVVSVASGQSADEVGRAAVSASTDATITRPAATHSNRMRIPRLGSVTQKTQVVPAIATPASAPANKREDDRRGIPTKARMPRESKQLKRMGAT